MCELVGDTVDEKGKGGGDNPIKVSWTLVDMPCLTQPPTENYWIA